MFLLASMTKLLTSIAALQLVEAGLIKLDDDVSKILPEVGQQKILKGFDGDTPILEDRKKPLTLRHVSGPLRWSHCANNCPDIFLRIPLDLVTMQPIQV